MPLPPNPGSINEIEKNTPGAKTLINVMEILGENGITEEAACQSGKISNCSWFSGKI